MPDLQPQSIERILCPCDFSESAKLALAQAVRFARRHGAQLKLAHVVEPVPLAPHPLWVDTRDDVRIRELATKRLEAIADWVAVSGIETSIQVEWGVPGPELIRIAREQAVSMIVIGTRGLTGLQHMLLGSTAEYVVRRSLVPVLAVHPEDRLIEESLETVLLPTDLSEHARAAVEAFVALFGRHEKPRVILAYADSAPPYLSPFRHEILERAGEDDTVARQIEARMRPIETRLKEAGFAVELRVLDGDPVEAIARLARERLVDLVLLSTHGRSALLNTLLGRTAQRIVQHAPCPVLTVRAERGGTTAGDVDLEAD